MKKLSAIVFLFAGLLSNAQSGTKHNLKLRLNPVFEGKPLNLSTNYITSGGDTVSIERFKFYISSITISFQNGNTYTEENSYHLIDAENAATLNVALPNVLKEQIKAISFNIGVDSVASVSGALAGELDPMKGMYWAWNSGYINAKLEGICKSKNKQYAFEFHVGGYTSPNYALRSVSVFTDKNNGEEIILNCDAAAWLQNVNLKKENSVVMPGPEAMRVADNYSKMFSVSSL